MDEENDNNNDNNELKLLETRASSYVRETKEKKADASTRHSKRNTNFIKCKGHNPESKRGDQWTTINDNCNDCIKFDCFDSFPPGKLPRTKTVLEFYIKVKERKDDAGGLAAMDLALHWICCNVYPCSVQTILKKMDQLYEEYHHVKHYPNNKKKITYWNNYNAFIRKLPELFDIIGSEEKIKTQEKFWNVKMIQKDRDFYDCQKKTPPTGYCDGYIDRKWQICENRKAARNNRSRSEHYEFKRLDVEFDVGDDPNESENAPQDVTAPSKRMKYEFSDPDLDVNDELPPRLRHIRSGMRSVRKEVYLVMSKLKTQYHMSDRQCEAAIVEVANTLFERKWKSYEREETVDVDTLPANSKLRRVDMYLEAMALASIVEEIMDDGHASVLYANDGSGMSGVGNYVVQSLTVNGVQRALPTFGIFSESTDSLEELEVTTLKMLSASTGHRYSEKDILQRIDFVMTDSTAHNLTVIENVSAKLGVEAPKSLTCNIHPLLMFQRKVTDVFQELHDTLGKERILDCFLVDVDFSNKDFITKAIQCLTSFVHKDFSSKPWNRQKHFDEFIKPKKNEIKSFKDQRFNRIFECCMSLTHHLDDIADYLEKYRNVVNGLSILDRSFVQMALLKPIFCSVALVGIHITKPYEIFLNHEDTKYSELLTAFPQLYEQLRIVNPEDMLEIDE